MAEWRGARASRGGRASRRAAPAARIARRACRLLVAAALAACALGAPQLSGGEELEEAFVGWGGELARERASDGTSVIRLSNGLLMPAIGLGTAAMGGDCRAAVESALSIGYTLLDTAQAYEWYREDLVAEGLRASGAKREDVWITTKIHPRDHGYSTALRAVERSLQQFQTSYLDLMLLHYPRCWGDLCGRDHVEQGTWRDSWRALEEAYAQGKLRAIGVSNFWPSDLEELGNFAREGPHVVQNWADPLHQDRSTRAATERIGAVYQAYSVLGTQHIHKRGSNPVLTHPTLVRIGKAHGDVGAAEVTLAWALQRGMAVIPRSTNPAHMRTSLAAADLKLTEAELLEIDALDGQ